MKGDVYLSQGKNESLRPSWEFAEKQRTCWMDWIMVILHGSYSHSLFFFKYVRDSVKFPMTKNLWSLPQAYPSINHWWSIIFATLRSLERVGPILLNMKTRYTVATNWHTFTQIYFWSLTLGERPESIIQCMTQREVCSCDYVINKWTPRYRISV